jgi:predicted O-linked N-acetylglucosamine transferase (SPINDLY family)
VNSTEKRTAHAALREAREAHAREDAALAESRCRAALALEPDDPTAWTLLGVILRSRAPKAAQAALARALELDPGNNDARFQLGNLHREQRRFAEAIAAYEATMARGAAHPGVLNNLGLAREGAGEPEQALEAYRAALALEPGHRQSLGNLVHLLCRLRRYAEAAPLCETYVERFRNADATLWVDRGICAHHAGDFATAEKSFEQARSLAPDDALILTNLGSLFIDMADFDRAEAVLARAVALDPESLYAASLLALSRVHLCAWAGLDALQQNIRRRLEAGRDDANAFAVLALPLSPAMQLAVARRWARDLASVAPARKTRTHGRMGKLRVGYVSSDFRTHATASLLAEVWERHDRARVATYAYSIGPTENSALRTRIEGAFDRFVDCSDDSIDETARCIAEDGIDVLIDLNGYTTHARSEIFALRPAPIQMSWLGYLGTLGAEWYDYVLTDRFACPPGLQQHFTERFLYLPDCYCPSDTRRPVAAMPAGRVSCGLPEQGFVFCCFNSAYKILPAVFAVWMRILGRAPNSVLWLAADKPTAIANLCREAQARGIDPSRLVFAPKIGLPEHLARHVLADLFLDTTPYNAGATANDALIMGLPLLTCAGDTMASRVAGSQLRALGLPDLVTASLDEYEALAVSLGSEPERLRDIKTRVRANRETHPLFDMSRFTRALDDLLCATWENRSLSNPR